MAKTFDSDEPIYEFNEQVLVIPHLSQAKAKMEMCDSVLLDLGHLLEDTKLNAAQMVKTTKYIIEWRKRRRYWKCVWQISEKLGATSGTLIGEMKKTRSFLEDNKAKSEESKRRLINIMNKKDKQNVMEL